MARTFTAVAPDSTGDKIAAQDIVDGADTVLRQEILVSDPTTLAAVAKVTNGSPGVSDYGLVVRVAGGSAAWTWVGTRNAAPAANSVQADTGALAVGDYELWINLAAMDTLAVGKGMAIEHRNAANSATLTNLGGCVASGQTTVRIERITLAANERVRVIAGTAAGAASSNYISAIGRRIL